MSSDLLLPASPTDGVAEYAGIHRSVIMKRFAGSGTLISAALSAAIAIALFAAVVDLSSRATPGAQSGEYLAIARASAAEDLRALWI
jgi:hypothetical protein